MVSVVAGLGRRSYVRLAGERGATQVNTRVHIHTHTQIHKPIYVHRHTNKDVYEHKYIHTHIKRKKN